MTGNTVKIVQLYPSELGLTGDRGNVRALQVRLERAGIPAEVVVAGIGDELPEDADVIVVGNGPLSAMRGVLDDIHARREKLGAAIEGDVPVLVMGASAELFSAGVTLLDGERLEGLGIVPMSVERTRERRVGYIIAETSHGRLIGFEDHASEWLLDDPATAYGVVTAGKGTFTTAAGRGETMRYRNAFATNVQGPLLPLNPQVSDEILRIAAARRGHEYAPAGDHRTLDELAAGARAAIEKYVDGEVFTYMQV